MKNSGPGEGSGPVEILDCDVVGEAVINELGNQSVVSAVRYAGGLVRFGPKNLKKTMALIC